MGTGGLHPTREDLTWAILLSFAAGFLSISAVALSVLDVARGESAVPAEEEAGSQASR
jgi:hypothetical protein